MAEPVFASYDGEVEYESAADALPVAGKKVTGVEYTSWEAEGIDRPEHLNGGEYYLLKLSFDDLTSLCVVVSGEIGFYYGVDDPDGGFVMAGNGEIN